MQGKLSFQGVIKIRLVKDFWFPISLGHAGQELI